MLTVDTGGDFLKGDGTGSFSIYGDKFAVRLFAPDRLEASHATFE